jgi:hypothetical protein
MGIREYRHWNLMIVVNVVVAGSQAFIGRKD